MAKVLLRDRPDPLPVPETLPACINLKTTDIVYARRYIYDRQVAITPIVAMEPKVPLTYQWEDDVFVIDVKPLKAIKFNAVVTKSGVSFEPTLEEQYIRG